MSEEQFHGKQEGSSIPKCPTELKNGTISVSIKDTANMKAEERIADYSLWSYFKACRMHVSEKDLQRSINEAKMSSLIVSFSKALLLLTFFSYFCAVLIIRSATLQEGEVTDWCDGDGLLIVISAIVFTGLFYFKIIKPYLGPYLIKSLKEYFEVSPSCKLVRGLNRRYLSSSLHAIAIAVFGVFILIDTSEDRTRLISASGIFVFCLVGFVFSTAPRKIIWKTVIWGIGLQFLLGLVVLRWNVGKATFLCLGRKVGSFLKFSNEGTTFVFGKLSEMGIFAFRIIAVVIFFSFCIKILYYYGAMQWMVVKAGWLLQVTVGTTACESVSAAANIFIGMCEAPLLIKPYLRDMTKSELHAVLTGGFATIAGGAMAAFASFGVDPTHLLCASVMSAPAALAISKVFYPETEISNQKAENITIPKRTETNALQSAVDGVKDAISLIANILANLIAFIAFIAFLDATFNWSCKLLLVEDGVCTVSNVMGYMFMPAAWIMGVQWDDCYYVGQLLGTKTILNEFLAYLKLVDYVKENVISKRSEAIATYALCGFSNIGSIGIQLGAIGVLVPERKSDIAEVIVRAMIAGTVACFMTACVAGTLIMSDETEVRHTSFNSSSLLSLE